MVMKFMFHKINAGLCYIYPQTFHLPAREDKAKASFFEMK